MWTSKAETHSLRRDTIRTEEKNILAVISIYGIIESITGVVENEIFWHIQTVPESYCGVVEDSRIRVCQIHS